MISTGAQLQTFTETEISSWKLHKITFYRNRRIAEEIRKLPLDAGQSFEQNSFVQFSFLRMKITAPDQRMN